MVVVDIMDQDWRIGNTTPVSPIQGHDGGNGQETPGDMVVEAVVPVCGVGHHPHLTVGDGGGLFKY